jgi:hypothetical protein
MLVFGLLLLFSPPINFRPIFFQPMHASVVRELPIHKKLKHDETGDHARKVFEEVERKMHKLENSNIHFWYLDHAI